MRFPIGGEFVTCRGLKLINPSRANKTHREAFDFRDLKPVCCVSWHMANTFFFFQFFFFGGGEALRVSGEQDSSAYFLTSYGKLLNLSQKQ